MKCFGVKRAGAKLYPCTSQFTNQKSSAKRKAGPEFQRHLPVLKSLEQVNARDF